MDRLDDQYELDDKDKLKDKLKEKSVFTTFEAAEICKVTPVTIQNWMDKGRLLNYRTAGGHRRVSRDTLLEFLQERGIPNDLTKEPPRVLIVDPTKHIAGAITQAFAGEIREDPRRSPRDEPAYEVEVAYDAFHAGRLYERMKPYVVILVLGHSKADGYEICRQMKEDHMWGKPVVLAIDSEANDSAANERRDRILKLGAAHFFPKSVNPAEVRQWVRSSFESRMRLMQGRSDTRVHSGS